MSSVFREKRKGSIPMTTAANSALHTNSRTESVVQNSVDRAVKGKTANTERGPQFLFQNIQKLYAKVGAPLSGERQASLLTLATAHPHDLKQTISAGIKAGKKPEELVAYINELLEFCSPEAPRAAEAHEVAASAEAEVAGVAVRQAGVTSFFYNFDPNDPTFAARLTLPMKDSLLAAAHSVNLS